MSDNGRIMTISRYPTRILLLAWVVVISVSGLKSAAKNFRHEELSPVHKTSNLGNRHGRILNSSKDFVSIRRYFDGNQTEGRFTKRLRRRKKWDRSPAQNVSTSNSDDRRNGRFLSLFTVIRFANEDCPATSGGNGTCYKRTDCSARGGVADGTCASGYGVCCRFEFGCGSSTSENGTYFNSPATAERICNFMLARANDDICQIRLELDQFDLAGPNADGECEIDFFLVAGGSSSQVPTLCGANSGQHLIYSITPNSGPSMLSVVLDTSVTSAVARTWSIRVLQFECSSRNLAPVGCLQYHQSEAGDIVSFNYNSEVNADNDPNHLANLNYAVCVRAANGYCGIKYSQASADPYSFTISNDASGTLTSPLPAGGVKFGDADCASDYVNIPGGSGDGALNSFTRDRFCGITLGACVSTTTGANTCSAAAMAVTSFVQPFVLHVVTDGDESGDLANRGFKLSYAQTPCQFG